MISTIRATREDVKFINFSATTEKLGLEDYHYYGDFWNADFKVHSDNELYIEKNGEKVVIPATEFASIFGLDPLVAIKCMQLEEKISKASKETCDMFTFHYRYGRKKMYTAKGILVFGYYSTMGNKDYYSDAHLYTFDGKCVETNDTLTEKN